MIPATCPHCGSGPDPILEQWIWACGTGPTYPFDRPSSCYRREAHTLRTRVRELEERKERLSRAITLAIRAYATAETKAETGPLMHDILEDAIQRDREAKP